MDLERKWDQIGATQGLLLDLNGLGLSGLICTFNRHIIFPPKSITLLSFARSFAEFPRTSTAVTQNEHVRTFSPTDHLISS